MNISTLGVVKLIPAMSMLIYSNLFVRADKVMLEENP